MQTVRLTKEFNFETAHALWNYDGKCKNIHGHSYKLFVTVKGFPINDINSPKNGMLIDFGNLKRIVNKLIVDKYDHAGVFFKDSPHAKYKDDSLLFEQIILTDYQPTCENMVIDFAEIISKALPENIQLFSIKLYETQTSFAEWFFDDNK